MSSKPTFETALEHVVLAARLRLRWLETEFRDDRGRWEFDHWQHEHAQLTAALETVEAAAPRLWEMVQ